MRIAVVGGGIFGVTTAIELGREGYTVDIFEQNDDILTAASGINQYRLHRGYHYPRSAETIQSSFAAAPLFREEYEGAVMQGHSHYYAIAKEGSLTSKDQYIATCKRHDLPFKEVTLDLFNSEAVELVIEAEEESIDIEALRAICKQRIDENEDLTLHLGTVFTREQKGAYDVVVVATYAALNAVLADISPECRQQKYQFELCEKPVFKLPDQFHNKSIVVMDGPFMCVDPLGPTNLFVMGHVRHAIHATNTGITPEIPDRFIPFLNKGVVTDMSISNADKFIETGSYFMPALKDAEYVGSMYTIRTVLSDVEHTDARPTLVNAIDDQIITIYSGKIGNSVRAARDVAALIRNRKS